MTAAHEQNIEAKKRRSRFVTQAEMVGQKVNEKSRRRKKQWDEIMRQVGLYEATVSAGTVKGMTSDRLVRYWKGSCQSTGIGAGVLSWFFWSFFLPYLIELAKNWIEAQQSAENSER